MNLFDALLKDMPKAAFKLNPSGTAYDDVTGHGNTLTGTLAFTSPLTSGNPKALSVNTAGMVGTSTTVFKRGREAQPFSLQAWVLPTTFTGVVSILSHTGVYDGLAFDGNNIRFRIKYSTLPAAEVLWPLPDFPEAVHISATYSKDKIQLYINRVLEAELELTSAQYADGFAAEPSSLLYCGQSASGTERLIVDGIAIFNRVLSRDNIASHFLAGRSAPTVADIVGQYGGGYFNGVNRDIALQKTWSTTQDWQAGVHSDISFAAGALVPLFNPATSLSLPGVWNGSLGLGSIPLANIQGIKILWNGDGIYTVKTSLDAITYTTRTNGEVIPNTTGINPAGGMLDIRITFAGGVALDVAQVRNLTLTVYSTNKIYGSDVSREITLTGAVSTALEHNEPIERNSAAGINFYGGYGTLSADLDAGAVRTNLCVNPSFEINTTPWTVVPGAGGACAISRPTMGGINDGAHGRATWSVASTSGGNAGFNYNNGDVCSPGEYVSAGVMVRSSLAQSVLVYIQYLNSGSTYLGGNSGTAVVLVPNVWTYISCNGPVAPATTTRLQILVYGQIGGSGIPWTVGSTFDIDQIFIAKASTPSPPVLPYFDGNGDGIWTGASNASTSVDKAYNPRNVAALELWVKPDSLTTNMYIFDARGAYAGYLWQPLASGLLAYAGHSAVYINGILTASGTKGVTVGEWTHIIYVATTPFNSSVVLANGGAEPFNGQMGLVVTYPAALTAAQALAIFNSYASPPSARGIDSTGIAIAELPSAYTNYVLEWSANGAGG